MIAQCDVDTKNTLACQEKNKQKENKSVLRFKKCSDFKPWLSVTFMEERVKGIQKTILKRA